jgi:MFS family permease
MTSAAAWSTDARLRLLLASCVLDIGATAVCLPGLSRHLAAFGCSDFHQGLLLSLNALCACATGPWLGRLSDAHGRVPLLRASSLVAALGYAAAAWATPHAPWGRALLGAARVLPGLCRAQVPCAQAYISDVSDAQSRGANMGLLGLAFGFAFMLGPALGGALASHLDSLAAPLVAAAALCALNACLLGFLPESHLPTSTPTPATAPAAAAKETAASMRRPGALAILGLDTSFWRGPLRLSAAAAPDTTPRAISFALLSSPPAAATSGGGRDAAAWAEQAAAEVAGTQAGQAACMRRLLLGKMAFSLAKGGYESLFTQHARRRFGSGGAKVMPTRAAPKTRARLSCADLVTPA